MKYENGERTIYTKDIQVSSFELERRSSCETPYAPKKYIDFVINRSEMAMGVDSFHNLCPSCARVAGAQSLVSEMAL